MARKADKSNLICKAIQLLYNNVFENVEKA